MIFKIYGFHLLSVVMYVTKGKSSTQYEDFFTARLQILAASTTLTVEFQLTNCPNCRITLTLRYAKINERIPLLQGMKTFF